ncbi:LOW QUALITY PROTEIN: reverse transcriptase [Phytophthora megakarya]|uniref:Reverse transcriptase n=1 Tax=Phytophthora megakarya TaxID=4795 RepID=A0A225VP03_9STRA|nr:LOW QUALITY PROTEIN: reverse transcriptase [Phytophthora megakarya]
MLKPKLIETVVSVHAITRPAERQRHTPKVMEESIVQRIRCQRIRQAQDEEKWIADLKKCLDGEVSALTAEEAMACSKIAANYEVDENGLLFFCPKTLQRDEDRDGVVRMGIPDCLQRDFLHHYHASLEGGHHGVGRTYRRIQANFHWRGLYRSVQRYVGECTDCETGKGKPTGQGESPGNIQGTYPFQVISMDHIPSLPKSKHRTTDLGRLVHRLSNSQVGPSREAQAVAENYEECGFRRFGASEVIRHDWEPGFMDFFSAFNRIVKMRQSAAMANRPQGNGKAERTVQTLTRALKMYVADVNQQDWDDYAERLTFALNTAYDRSMDETRGRHLKQLFRIDTPPRLRCTEMEGQYRRAREAVNENLREAIKSRADRHNENVRPHRIEEGTLVWLYLDRVKEGYARKLAHMWHGPFRVTELIGNHAARLETAGSGYRIFPIVHLSKLKPVQTFPDRPKAVLNTEDDDRVHIDEELLPDDS